MNTDFRRIQPESPTTDETIAQFQEAFQKTFGKPSSDIGGKELILVDWLASPVGPLLLAAMPSGLCLLEFSASARLQDQRVCLQKKFGATIVPQRNAHLEQMKAQLIEYFQGKRRDFDVAVITRGSAFEERVWAALCRIPYGQTCSYSDLAGEIGAPGAVRAVGAANGRNPIAIVIPCHRVITRDHRLGGYGGGLWRKQFLLDLEYKTVGEPYLLTY